MKNIKQKWIVALATAVLSLPLVQAQDQGLGDMMFTAGTVATDTSGQEWAWLQWMATDSAMLKDRPMEIYRSAGEIGSGNPLVLKGSARQTTDPRSIALLLTHGEALGENITNLTASVDSLYTGAAPIASLSLEAKLAALISGSQDDPELYQNLVFIGRAHPSVAMAIGQGFACRVPTLGSSTFEIRDLSTGEVIGRLELESGNPLVLPAPGPIARVSDPSPKGNLNIRLQWGIPDNLKRLSLLQFGYNVYRMTQPFAEDKGYDLSPPSPSIIADLVEGQDVVKVNRAPILIDPATATTNTWFVIDDNDGLSGGTPFVDGENYYYFVSALDLLGRDGQLSDGFMTFPCDRFAPSVPHEVRTRTVNDFISGVHTQWIEVSWAHDPADPDTARYYVYRHTGVADMQSNATSAVINRIAGPLVPAPSATRIAYEDHSLSSNDFSRTYWYTVRAEDNASCGPNLSGNSAPAFGLVRDWKGPPPLDGVVVTLQTEIPETTFKTTTYLGLPDPDNLRITCELASPNLPLAWTQFGWHWGTYEDPSSETNIIATSRFYFPEGVDEISRDYFIDGTLHPNEYVITVYCRVGSSSGAISEWARASNEKPESSKTEYTFEGNLSPTQVPVPADGSDPGAGPHVWGVGPNIAFPTLFFPGSAEAKTVRVYRRVDGGTRTLIHQGEVDEVLGVVVTDYTGGSVNGGTICYYYQQFDEHGNAGPMVFIHCFEVAPRVDLPTPVLKSVDSIGTAIAAPGMALEWFCTTPGVERFEVAVALDETGPLPTFGTSAYALHEDTTNLLSVVVGGVTNALNFGFYRTGRVGTTFGSAGSPEFTLDSLAELDRDYTIMVRAIGVAGIPGPWSNIETFRWSTVPTVGPDVPWPARSMPTVQTQVFHADMGAAFLGASYFGLNDRVGIRIGEFPVNYGVEFSDKVHSGQIFYPGFDPMEQLYTNSAVAAQTMMPCVLYRYQLANSLYPIVSGDVAQVSPLMENIAYGTNNTSTIIYDPFIGLSRKSAADWGIYLLDTQPVVSGARYQYLLMRFDEETKELDRIIPAGIVTIP